MRAADAEESFSDDAGEWEEAAAAEEEEAEEEVEEEEEEEGDDDDDNDDKVVGSNAAITPKSAEVTPSSSPSKISPKADDDDEVASSAVPVLPVRAAQGKQPPRWTLKHAIMNSPRALRKQHEGGDIDGPASSRKVVNQEPSPPIAADDGDATTTVAVGDFDVDDNGSIDYDDI